MSSMNFFRRFLAVRPDFIRLINAIFAVLVAFEWVDITAEQFGVIVLAVESLFQYLSKLAFEKDVDDLASIMNAPE